MSDRARLEAMRAQLAKMAKNQPKPKPEEDPRIPWGYSNGSIRLSEVENDPMFLTLDPVFRQNVLRMIRENPTIGIGGADRTEADAEREFYRRYALTDMRVEDFDPNDKKMYDLFKKGKLKEYGGKIYRLKPNMAAVAVPKKSFHTGGYAIDILGDKKLAGKIARRYGIMQVTGTGEDWHFQPAYLPAGRRVIDFVKDRYGIDITKDHLTREAIDYFDRNFASNAPAHSQQIYDDLDRLLGSPVANMPAQTPNAFDQMMMNRVNARGLAKNRPKPKSMPYGQKSSGKAVPKRIGGL